jgi:hypothetical protein
MHTEAIANRGDHVRRERLVHRGPRRKTALARRRRLNRLVRELATDLGFDIRSVSLAEHAILHQSATLMLQVEVAQDQLVGGTTIDPDTCIRLSSEARRLLTGLRKRAKPGASPPRPWSPLRARITAPVTPKTEPAA